jgi:ABC-type enterochelin transport system substrate-binding protein
VTDSRGTAVQVPEKINRVVSISDGLIEGMMIALGVEDKLVGVGSRTFQEIDNYTYPHKQWAGVFLQRRHEHCFLPSPRDHEASCSRGV